MSLNTVTRLILTACLAGAFVACGDPAPDTEPPPQYAPPPDPEPTAEAETPAAPEPAEEEIVVLAGNAEAGAAPYGQFCASCHGAAGGGDGPLSASLNPAPAAHSDGSYMNALSDEHLFKVVKLGGTAVGKSALMAPWGGTLDDQQVWDVVAFMRSLADPPYSP